ncbi:MAG: M3 family metallopeptidase [Flavobacteriaceae bacterium]|jgi:peptidyl-dipeptidase Dcp|nr:M3 family metallopeptidase [Flavobacteriaceae bacterium]
MNIKTTVVGSLVVAASLFAISCNNSNGGKTAGWDESNAFYTESQLPYHTADFSKIKNKDFKPALLEGMRQQMVAIDSIANNKETPSFANTIEALERSSALLDRANAVFNLLTGADTNDELQEINAELTPQFASHNDAIYLNEKIYNRIKVLLDTKPSLNLTPEQDRLLEVYYHRFVEAGANLVEADKKKLKELNQEIAALSNTFSDKLLAATKAAGLTIKDVKDLVGLSQEDIAALKQKDNTYLLPINNTTQQPLAASLSVKDVRSKLFEKSWTRAELGDENDTQKTLLDLVAKRAEKAKLLGFENYAAWSLQNTMAESTDNAIGILKELVPYANEAAKVEIKEIQEAIAKTGESFEVNAADWDYYAEKIREEKYALNQNELKPYFEMNAVLEKGVFFMAKQLYGLTFKERKDLPTWHEDVKVYEIFNEDKSPLGLFYTDYYQRDSKRGGAWMSNIVEQSHLLKHKPVIYNVANFQKPAKGQPTLLTQDNVITIFHEFGHALHGLFADQMYPSLAGTNVARDFVEFPSQFHEHFAFEPSILQNYAKHYKTGEVIPSSLIEKMKNAANFNKGYSLSELLGASLLDMEWHTLSSDSKVTDVKEFEQSVMEKYGIPYAITPPRYRSSYFSHIFAGGYAAGYYSYKWSEMLDYDAYAWLEENGGMTRENGEKLRRELFSRGNTKILRELYGEFRGKEATLDAFLHYQGFKK